MRKDELARMERNLTEDVRRDYFNDEYRIGNFIKDECYPKPKVARGIANTSDQLTIRTGPIFKLIEKEVFSKEKSFVKAIPVSDRVAYARDRLGDFGPYKANDFTSWEGLQSPELMDVAEWEVYRYMVAQLGTIGEKWLALVQDADTVSRKYVSRAVDIECEGKRKSGSPNTSLGNGLNNFLLFNAFNREFNWKSRGLFEGDDSIFTDPEQLITHDPWTALGIITKIEEHPTLNTTSFCGNVFADQDFKTLTNPVPKLLGFSWMPIKYRSSTTAYKLQLLKSKALSLKVSYPDHPVLSSFSNWIIRCTRNVTIRKSINEGKTYWEKRQLAAITPKAIDHQDKPGTQSRFMIAELYGVPLATQLRLENKFDNMQKLETFDLESFIIEDTDVSGTYSRNWSQYVCEDRGQRTITLRLDTTAQALNDLKPLSRRLKSKRERSMLPANYPYEEDYNTHKEVSARAQPLVKSLRKTLKHLKSRAVRHS